MNAETMLAEARAQTDRLFGLVRADSLYERPIPERHRIIFYLGHLEAFDWNLLGPHRRDVTAGRARTGAARDEQFDRLFAFGIDPVNGGLPADVPADWPSVDEVRRYGRAVREALDEGEHDGQLLHMAVEHRLMHAETLAYMLHRLRLARKIPEAQVEVPLGEPVGREMVDIPAGCATLGMAKNGHFGWDNEFDGHTVEAPAFAIERYKVTNRAYLRFMEAGGYRNARFWSEGGWQWITRHQITHPAFWEFADGEWRYRAMFEVIALPPEWPVYVSQAEASAYAAWAGLRLPTEAEWHRAAYATEQGGEREFPWGEAAPAPEHGYFDGARWDPAPVNAYPGGRSAFGVDGLAGNGWEWTATPFGPFGGFQAHPSYPGYSADFFDTRHYVLKGGSTRTAACMLRRSFRNWFQPHYQYVYAGFRCAKGV